MSGNRIDPTSPVRISTNLSIGRQTAKTDFGDRVRSGLETTAGLVAQGAGIAAPFVPGGAILSAAVSSVSTLGQQLGGATGQYQAAATGVVSLGSGGGLSTTLPGSVGGLGGSAPNVLAGGTGGVNMGGGGIATGGMNTSMSEASDQMGKLLQTQIAVQRENQVFSTVSNVLKARHDTVKNTISNVR